MPPCILYNLNGYYNDLQALLRHMIEMGLSTEERQEGSASPMTLPEFRRYSAGSDKERQRDPRHPSNPQRAEFHTKCTSSC